MTPDPIPEYVGVRANMVFIKKIPVSKNISSDQTGRFSFTPAELKNASWLWQDITVKPSWQSRSHNLPKQSYSGPSKVLYNNITYRGLQPCLHMLDNK